MPRVGITGLTVRAHRVVIALSSIGLSFVDHVGGSCCRVIWA